MTAAAPDFAGFKFALLSMVTRVTDAALERIMIADTLMMADVCCDYKEAPTTIRIISSLAELKDDETPCTYEENIGDPAAAAFHEQVAGRPVIRVAAGVGTQASDWENDTGHEIAETVGNADCVTFKEEVRADGTVRFHCAERCDRAQGQSKGMDIGRGDPVNIPNVLLSGYWKLQPAFGEKLDLLGLIKNPFELQDNSYGIYVMGSGGEQQEASGNLAARRISAMAPHDRVVIAGAVPARKIPCPDSRFMRLMAAAHAFSRGM